MASLKDYDFNALLDDPCDMFSIQLNVMSQEHQLLGTVKSHKLLLSLMSPVLQDMFTSQEENWNVIEINAVSVLSVQTLIQFLYNGDESIITGVMDLNVLFELYYLGKTYQIRGSSDLLKDAVLGFNISKENLIDVLKLIKKYEENYLFEDLCNILQGKCLEVIRKYWDSAQLFLENIQACQENIHYGWVENRIQKWSENPTGGLLLEEGRGIEEQMRSDREKITNLESEGRMKASHGTIQLLGVALTCIVILGLILGLILTPKWSEYQNGPDYQAELGKLEAAGRTKDNTIQELMKRIEELVEEQQLQGHCKIGDWTDYSMIKDLEQEIEEGLTERLGLEQTVTILKFLVAAGCLVFMLLAAKWKYEKDKLDARSEEVWLIQEELGEIEEQLHKEITDKIEKLKMETVDNREKIKILEAEGTANKETIKEHEKKLKDNREKIKILEAGETANKETIKEQEKKLKDNREKIKILEAEGTANKETIKEQEKKLKDNITDFTEKLEKLMVENEDLKNKLENQADKFQEEKQELQNKQQGEKQELQDKFQGEKQELTDKIQVQLQMISSMEGKHNEFIKKTEETLGLTRTLLKSMEFKVMDPVCPAYYTGSNYTYCGKKIRLEEMSQHLVSCEHLQYLQSRRNMILNTEYEHWWFRPSNFKISNKPLVYKLKESQHFFILQGRSTDTSLIFYIIQHNEENISEHQYIARLEVYGETKNIIRSQTVRVCPSGINLENARNQLYTLDISQEELEIMSVRKIPTDDVSKKYNMCVKFKVMII
ncbi:uncharacterized protein LOC111710307 isoform X2 [Eurytemora carolleeae]|uniref:uncharacterized protein LOC111710307 isoform X2 n=1 Tax=Eurytemora carolleeae TaxID=1294199 RepID=UPI000C75DD49|nr:uncharacterized protein LOC111710307 isoform X2 [Eurytemora carolleeae]|eukprot:XP_023340132.1 uncharacterized protein LOC111710307 isoform X2 [Eurytemora affinis]